MRVRQLGDPILRLVSDPVQEHEFGGEAMTRAHATMEAILDGIKSISDQNGNAISAPQVGLSKRFILLRLQGEFVPMVNPQIIARSEETLMSEEECFSFYGLRGEVDRAMSVNLNFQDPLGNWHARTLHGEEAALAQHEIDHLDGILFLDRLHSPTALSSIEYVLKDDPARLEQVKALHAFMAG